MLLWLGEVTSSTTLKAAIAGGVVLCGVMLAVGLNKSEDEGLREQARTAYRAACAKDRDPAQCDALLEASHEDCAIVAMVRPGRYSQGSKRMDMSKYTTCVDIGIKAHQERRRKALADTERPFPR